MLRIKIFIFIISFSIAATAEIIAAADDKTEMMAQNVLEWAINSIQR